MTQLRRRAAVGGLSALALARCAGAPVVDALAPPRRYADRPDMMAIGDSLYQGVRTFSFKPGLAPLSPPAQVAQALKIARFVVPDLERQILFDLEHLFTSILPIEFELLPYLATTVTQNALYWFDRRGRWSRHQAFDNISIGGAGIRNLTTDTYAKHIATFEASVRAGSLIDPSQLFETWYALAAAYTLNPQGRDEQAERTPLQQVADRRPRVLLVNIGSNEGLSSGCLLGNVAQGLCGLETARAYTDDLARQLAELPREVETIVFNGVLRPRFVPNMMPAVEATAHPPGKDYYDAYGPWIFRSDQPISRALMQEFDGGVEAFNAHSRSVLQRQLGQRLVFVDLYATCDKYDGKHYGNRGVSAGGRLLANVPLTRQGELTFGGMASLDNLHPTGPGYSIIADAVLEAMGSAARADPEAELRQDTLLADLPRLLDIRQGEIRKLYQLLGQIGAAGMGSPPAERAVKTKAASSGGLTGAPLLACPG